MQWRILKPSNVLVGLFDKKLDWKFLDSLLMLSWRENSTIPDETVKLVKNVLEPNDFLVANLMDPDDRSGTFDSDF